MTKNQFKDEIIADLEHQLEHKGKHHCSEAWYMRLPLYETPELVRRKAIEELINEGLIVRFMHCNADEPPWPVLVLTRNLISL
jgi:hypothetical protein